MPNIFWRNLKNNQNASDRGNYAVAITGTEAVSGTSLLPTDTLIFPPADTFAPSGSFQNVISLDAPVLWYRFNETGGTICTNFGSAGSAANGNYSATGITYSQTPLLSGGFTNGTSVKLNGINGRILIPNNNIVNYGEFTGKTFEIMFNADSINANGKNFLYEQGDFYSGMSMYISGGKLCSGIWDGDSEKQSYLNTDDSIITGSTYYISTVYDGPSATHKLFVNGIISKQQTDYSTIPASVTNLLATPASGGVGAVAGTTKVPNGFISNGSYFNGRIDELTVYNVALSDSNIRRHASAAFGLFDQGVTPATFTAPVYVDSISGLNYANVVSFGSQPVTANNIVFGDETNVNNLGTMVFTQPSGRLRIGRSVSIPSSSRLFFEDPFYVEVGAGANMTWNFPPTQWAGKDFHVNKDGSKGTITHTFQGSNSQFNFKEHWSAKNIYVYGGKYSFNIDVGNNNPDRFVYSLISGAPEGGYVYLYNDASFDFLASNISAGSTLRDTFIVYAPIDISGYNITLQTNARIAQMGNVNISGKLTVNANTSFLQSMLCVNYDTPPKYKIRFRSNPPVPSRIIRTGGGNGSHFWIGGKFYADSGIDTVELTNNTNFNAINAYISFDGFPITGSDSYPRLILSSDMSGRTRFSYFPADRIPNDIDVVNCDFRYSPATPFVVDLSGSATNLQNIRFISTTPTKSPSITLGTDILCESFTVTGGGTFYYLANAGTTITPQISGNTVILDCDTIGVLNGGKVAINSVNAPIDLRRSMLVANSGSVAATAQVYFNSMNMNGHNIRTTHPMGFISDSPLITNSITGDSWIYGSGTCSWFGRSGGLPTPETVRFGTRGGLFLYGRDAYNNTMINSITGSSSYTVPHGQMNDGPVYIRNNRDNLTVTFLGSFACRDMNINPNYLSVSPTSGALNVILENSTFGCGDYNFNVIGENKSNTQHNLTLNNSVILTGRIAANYTSLKNNKWNLHASGDSRIYSYRSGSDAENNFTLFDKVPSNNLQSFAYGGNVEYGLRHGEDSSFNNGNSPVTYNHIGFGVPLYEKAYPYASKVSPSGNWTKAIPKVITGEYVESFPLGSNTTQGDGFRYYQVDAVAGDAIVTSAVTSAGPQSYDFIFEGDSITAYIENGGTLSSTNQWDTKFCSDLALANFINNRYNVARGGEKLADIVSQYNTEVRPNRPSVTGSDRAYLFVEIGSNDINQNVLTSATSGSWLTSLQVYTSNAQADGFKVGWFNILPRTNFDATKEWVRSNVSSNIMASTIPDLKIDIESVLPNPADTVYYSDGVHPTAAGATLIANEAINAITPLLPTSVSVDSYVQIYDDKNFQHLIGDYDDYYNGSYAESISKFIFPETRTYWIGIGTYSSYGNYTYISSPGAFMEVKYVKDADVTGYCTITNPYTYNNAPTVDTLEFNGGVWDYGSMWWEGAGYSDSMNLNNLFLHKNMGVLVNDQGFYDLTVNISGTYLNNTDIPDLVSNLNVKVYGRYVFRPNHTIQDVNANGGERLNIVRNKDFGNTQNIVYRRPW